MNGEVLELFSERVARISRQKFNKGYAMGLSQAQSQQIEKIIINMINSNYSDSEIMNITGCNMDELIRIRHANAN